MPAAINNPWKIPDIVSQEERRRLLARGTYVNPGPTINPETGKPEWTAGGFRNQGRIAGTVPESAGNVGPNYNERLAALDVNRMDDFFGQFTQEQYVDNQRRQRLQSMLPPTTPSYPFATTSEQQGKMDRAKSEFETLERGGGPKVTNLLPGQESGSMINAPPPSAPITTQPGGKPIAPQTELQPVVPITPPEAGAPEEQPPILGIFGQTGVTDKDTMNFLGQLEQSKAALEGINTKEDYEKFLKTLSGSEVPGMKGALNRAGEIFLQQNNPQLYSEIVEHEAYKLAIRPKEKAEYALLEQRRATNLERQRKAYAEEAILHSIGAGSALDHPVVATKKAITNAADIKDIGGLSWTALSETARQANLTDQQTRNLYIGANAATYRNNPANLLAKIGIEWPETEVRGINAKNVEKYNENVIDAVAGGMTAQDAIRDVLKSSGISPKSEEYRSLAFDVAHMVLTEQERIGSETLAEVKPLLAAADAPKQTIVNQNVSKLPQQLADATGVEQLFKDTTAGMQSTLDMINSIQGQGLLTKDAADAWRSMVQQRMSIPTIASDWTKEQFDNAIFTNLAHRFRNDGSMAAYISQQQALYNSDPVTFNRLNPGMTDYLDLAYASYGKGAKSYISEVEQRRQQIISDAQKRDELVAFQPGTSKVAITVRDAIVLKAGKIPKYTIKSVMPEGGDEIGAFPVTIRKMESIIPQTEQDWTDYFKVIDNDYTSYPEIHQKIKAVAEEAKQTWEEDKLAGLLGIPPNELTPAERKTISATQKSFGEPGHLIGYLTGANRVWEEIQKRHKTQEKFPVEAAVNQPEGFVNTVEQKLKEPETKKQKGIESMISQGWSAGKLNGQLIWTRQREDGKWESIPFENELNTNKETK